MGNDRLGQTAGAEELYERGLKLHPNSSYLLKSYAHFIMTVRGEGAKPAGS